MRINESVEPKLKDKYSYSFINCSKIGCHMKDHLEHIDKMYTNITDVVREATDIFRKQSIRTSKHKVIPGWNRHVKHLHSVARDHYLLWISEGKHIGSHQHMEMINTRKLFKKALNECKQNEQ